MRVKPFLFATTLAIALGVASAPAEAQFYTGGSSVTIGGPGGFFSFSNGPVIAPPLVNPVVPFGYPSYITPVSPVIVQPPTVVAPLPYSVYGGYGPAWGTRVYTRSYGYYGRPYGVYGRRGWW